MGLFLVMLAALLVVTPLSTAQHVNFYRMSSKHGCATGLRMYYPAIWRVESECGLPAVNHTLVQQSLLLVSIKI